MESVYLSGDDCVLDDFVALTSKELHPGAVRHATRVEGNIPQYDADAVAPRLGDATERPAVLSEWARVLGEMSGVLVIRGAYADTSILDAATALYEGMIFRQKQAGAGRGDHFAQSGANDRIWNALQKLCTADPSVFARYFGNPVIAAVCEAWLGPAYQMTAQVNVVRPGGKAQSAHRDYHLGFQSAEAVAHYPAHVHTLSAALTLQGAIAHCDMPLESGPTKLLPFSQLYAPGYLAYHRPEFRAYFEVAHVQVPLAKGDAVFFNPALFHAAGENSSTHIQRMANLLQVSSAFGRAMESVDRLAMCRALYPVLLFEGGNGQMTPAEVAAAVAAAAEGYAFPTNLDSDPPLGGMAPESQAGLMHRALKANMSPKAFQAELDALALRRKA